MTNRFIQQKEHKKFAFIIGDSMIRDIVGYLLAASLKGKFIEVWPFHWPKR